MVSSTTIATVALGVAYAYGGVLDTTRSELNKRCGQACVQTFDELLPEFDQFSSSSASLSWESGFNGNGEQGLDQMSAHLNGAVNGIISKLLSKAKHTKAALDQINKSFLPASFLMKRRTGMLLTFIRWMQQ